MSAQPGLASPPTRLAVRWSALRSAGPQLLLAAATFGLYVALSLARYRHMDAGVDLAIFGQAVEKYAHWQLPWSDIKAVSGFNLLGDHFSPVVALAAPAYWLVPHVWVLLVVQAGLIALTTFLVARVVARRIGQGAGLLIGAIYALAWGTQWLALFDFHEVAFALPLVALCYLRLLEGRDRSAVLWALPLMLVKEDSVFLLLGLALVLLARHRFRLAAMTSASAVGTFALIVGVIIPRISYYGRYTYWSSSAAGGNFVFRSLTDLVHAFGSGQAPRLLAVLLLPTLGLALRSPLMLGVIPPLLSRWTSPDATYWGAEYHYNATITVITVIALADAITRMDRQHLARRLLAGCLGTAVVMSFWAQTGRVVTQLQGQRCGDCEEHITTVLGHVPDGARVTAADGIASYLVDRTTVIGLHEHFVDSTGRPVDPDYIVVEDPHTQGWQTDWFTSQAPQLDYHLLGEAVRLQQPGLRDYDVGVFAPGPWPVPPDPWPLPGSSTGIGG
jgi:uncharacterized membrane protein